MKKDSLRLDEIILALPSMPKLLSSLLNKGKNYDPIILELLKCDYLSEDRHFPSPKELHQKTNITYDKIRKQLREIYDDALAVISSPDTVLCPGDKLCEIYIHWYHKHITIYAKLAQHPQIGEHMEIPLLRPYFKIDTFYVQKVSHSIKNDDQYHSIWLAPGFFNLYEFWQKDKAKFEDRYDWMTDQITEPEENKRRVVEVNRNSRYW